MTKERALKLLNLNEPFTEDDLNKAFRSLTNKWHPDKFASDTPEYIQAQEKMTELRDQLEAYLIEQADPVIINGSGKRVCNTSNLCFPGAQGEDLIIALDMRGIAVSHGSACSSGALEPSRILVNMGLSHTLARCSIRISLSRMTTEEEIKLASSLIAKTIKDLRS